MSQGGTVTDRTHPTHSHGLRVGLLGILAVGLIAGSVGAGALSLALFTSTAASSGNAFTSGTVVIGVTPASTAITATNMMPGDTVNGSLTVSNTGTAQLRYAMSSASTNTDTKSLRDQLQLTVKSAGTSCTAFDGTSLFSGALSAAAFGSVTAGQQTGDRTLNAGANEVLCFRVTLPAATGNAFQGASTTATFTFDAEQTANNP
jgi:spore coat-associated protein N